MENRPKGILSFLYHIRYNIDGLKERFHSGEHDEVLAEFDVPRAVRDHFQTMGYEVGLPKGSPEREQIVSVVVEYLASEISEEHYDKIW